jgi:acylpyruvate hydrolase
LHFATVALADGTSSAAVRSDERWRQLDAPDLGAALSIGLDRLVPGKTVLDPTFLQPVRSPGKVICCGLSYADHIRETGRQAPEYPTLFAKYADTLIGPTDDIRAPHDVQLDWEAELAVVVGRTVRRASREQAEDAIAGYTVANDVSLRDWQSRTLQWFQGKAWDATTPVGPMVVTPDEFDPSTAAITCTVNGVERQHGDTGSLVFGAADLIVYISTFTTLRPGDIILTGTPGGVGMGMTPPMFLKDGDVVQTTISDIGTLTNRVSLS